jgi:hypothetical protein
MAIAADLQAAFAAADYRILAGGGAILTRLQCPSPALAQLQRDHGVQTSSLLSARNPRGRALDAERNRARDLALATWLHAAGWRWLPAEGAAPDRHWVEPGFWVPGLAGEPCRDVMRAYEQLAWVEYDATGVGTLCFSGLSETRGGEA